MDIHLRNLSWYIIPILSLILSLPTLLSCLTFGALICYEVIIGDMRGTVLLSVLNFLKPPLFAPFVLYMVFGPILACLLCTVQLTRFGQESTLLGISDRNMYRTTRIILLLATVTIGLLLITVVSARLVRGPT